MRCTGSHQLPGGGIETNCQNEAILEAGSIHGKFHVCVEWCVEHDAAHSTLEWWCQASMVLKPGSGAPMTHAELHAWLVTVACPTCGATVDRDDPHHAVLSCDPVPTAYKRKNQVTGVVRHAHGLGRPRR